MISFFKEYLKINTAHPSPDYNTAISFFEKHAIHGGLATKRIDLPSGNTVLVIELQGTDKSLPALAINHHMDVVAVFDSANWDYSPFLGTFENNIFYGRGAQDAKGLGVAHYFALNNIKSISTLKRTVYMICMPDEEIGGFKGAKELVCHPEFKKLNIGYVLDEGLPSSKGGTIYIKVSERKPIQIKIFGVGQSAHSSLLRAQNILHELILCLQEIVYIHNQSKIGAEFHDGLKLSTHVTSIEAMSSITTIPYKASATVDFRIPPNMSLSDARDMIESLINKFPSLSYEILAQAQEEFYLESYHESNFYQNIKTGIKKLNFDVEPLFFEASSDLRFFKQAGIEGYGLSPFTCKDNLHGTNESLPLSNLHDGVQIFTQIIKDFCL